MRSKFTIVNDFILICHLLSGFLWGIFSALFVLHVMWLYLLAAWVIYIYFFNYYFSRSLSPMASVLAYFKLILLLLCMLAKWRAVYLSLQCLTAALWLAKLCRQVTTLRNWQTLECCNFCLFIDIFNHTSRACFVLIWGDTHLEIYIFPWPKGWMAFMLQ